jgi:hypothetical protein
MDEQKRFTGTSPEDAWEQVTTDVTWQEGANNYRAIIHTGHCDVELETVRSPGAIEEGGFEQTTFRAPVPSTGDFRFAIVPEDFVNRIGKLFGMQDVKIGYAEFDKNVLVQTNDEQKLKSILSNPSVREVFQNLSGYSLHIDKHGEGKGDYLHLVLQHAITDNATMRTIFSAFNKVLKALEQ